MAQRTLTDALTALVEDVKAESATDRGVEALGLWLGSPAGALHDEDLAQAFVSEVAFAAIARAALESVGHHGNTRERLAHVFPHLYAAPFFSWYEPRTELEETIETCIDELRAATSMQPAELVGWLYQFSVPDNVRKALGHFYTPSEIVEFMLDQVGYEGASIIGRRLIDPANGAGAYLIGATRRLLREARAAGLSAADRVHAVQSAIYGFDINPLGTLLTEAALGCLLLEELGEAPLPDKLPPLRLYFTDSLRRDDSRFTGEPGDVDDIKRCRGEYTSGFDFVIANPPYAKYPSRLLTDEQAERFSTTLYGHPNLYGMFLQLGVELLGSGGRIAYINPASFLSGLYFRKLRRFLDRNLRISRFDTFENRTGLFDGVLQELIILSGHRRPEGQEADPDEEITLCEFAGLPNGDPRRALVVKRQSVILDDAFDKAFFVTADPLAHRLLERMIAAGVPLASLGFTASTGTIVWNRVKPLIRDASASDALPLIWGNGIRAFRFLGIGNRAGGGTHVELARKTENIVTHGESLLVKRMTAKEEHRRIVACRTPSKYADDPRGYFVENHVNVIRPTEDGADLDLVLGLLNSSLFDYVFRALNGNTQVSATELLMLPVADGEGADAVADAARALTAAGGGDTALQQKLDKLVAKLYGVTDADVEALLERV
jgi:adenine-specific DNA-methyltransferase